MGLTFISLHAELHKQKNSVLIPVPVPKLPIQIDVFGNQHSVYQSKETCGGHQ